MAKVLNQILDSFYEKLLESETVDEATVNELRALFSSDKKPKADDFVAIFEKAAKEVSHDSD